MLKNIKLMLKLKYGTEIIEVPFREGYTDQINITEPSKVISTEKFYHQLEEYFNNKKAEKNIIIVVSDKTRLCGYKKYLPVLIKFLQKRNAKKIDFIIAYGTHKRQSEKECLDAYGEIYKKFHFIHPEQKENEKYINFGITKKGTPVTVRKEILEYDQVITFGAISYHYFAGYGGGRKMLFPGLASNEAIYRNHSLFLDTKNNCLQKNCQPGILTENPLAEDLMEIDAMLPPKISILGIMDSRGTLCELFLTDTYSEFEAICKKYDRYFMISNAKLYDLVIASSGGYPKDINFIQAHKSVHNSADFVKDGGKLIVFTECIDGIGSETFLKYLAKGYDKAFKILKENYEGNGGTALSMMEKSRRIDIFLVTSLSKEVCDQIGAKKIQYKEVLDLIKNEKGETCFIESAGLTIRK